MKSLPILGVCLVCVLALTAFSGNASAYSTTVDPFGMYSTQVDVVPNFDLTYDWSSDYPLTFIILDPQGSPVRTVLSSTSESGSIQVSDWGTYTLTWTNIGAQSVSLTYDYSIDPLQAAENWLDRILLIAIIGVVVVVVIIVLVIYLVVRPGSKRAPPQGQMMYPPQQVYGPPAAAPGVCPTCGSPVDPNFQFCSKCGARTR